jgi:hypothetical protein
MMSHVPLRGMVRQKVLDMFVQMYQAGGQQIDLHAPPPVAPGFKGRVDARVERVARWYVARKQRRNTPR